MAKTIERIYWQYQIMPNLQLHQRRVAAVAKTICENLKPSEKTKISTSDTVTACLLHDMGNIIKFDLTKFPEFLGLEGLVYWETVQASFFVRYGRDEHEASMEIARELGVSKNALELIDAIGFGQTEKNYHEGNLEKMICEYADDRVAISGIVSLEERIKDLEKRYQHTYPTAKDAQNRRRFAQYARKIEDYIFERTSLKPSQLTESRLSDTINDLKSWTIVP